MSLIQDALTKTQVKVAPKVAAPALQPKVQPQSHPRHGLDAFDREVEKKIQQVQRQPVKPVKKSYWSLIIVLAIFSAVAAWWFLQKPQTQMEPVPAMIVDIQKSTFVSKPELAQPILLPATAALAEEPKPIFDNSKFILSGIILGGREQPYALINGRIARVGDRVQHNAVVSKIEKEYVDVRYRGELVRLQIQR